MHLPSLQNVLLVAYTRDLKGTQHTDNSVVLFQLRPEVTRRKSMKTTRHDQTKCIILKLPKCQQLSTRGMASEVTGCNHHKYASNSCAGKQICSHTQYLLLVIIANPTPSLQARNSSTGKKIKTRTRPFERQCRWNTTCHRESRESETTEI